MCESRWKICFEVSPNPNPNPNPNANAHLDV